MSDIRGGPNAAHRLDLEGAPDSSDIVGREFEEKQLARWLVAEARRFVVVHGLRGMGKTTLAAKVLESVSASFDHVVWRSLQGGLPRRDLVAQLTAVVAPAAGPPGEGEADFEPLLRALASTRCLLVLDNAESLLVPERSGEFLPQYAGFLDLFLALANRPHRSAVLVTTREKFAGELQASTHVRWLPLAGLKGPSVKAILENAGASLGGPFRGALGAVSQTEWQGIADRCGGNPLALKLLAHYVFAEFAGRIDTFLDDPSPLPRDIELIIDWHIDRLSPQETDVVHWLAALREPVTANALRAYLIEPDTQGRVHDRLQELARRMLIERGQDQVWLQPVILERVTTRLVEQVSAEIQKGSPELLKMVGLLVARKDYVRDAQRRLRLEPVVERLKAQAESDAPALQRLDALLAVCHGDSRAGSSYLPVNVLHLYRAAAGEVRGLDFSKLTIRYPFLSDASAIDVNFTSARFIDPLFAQTFANARTVALSPDGTRLATAGGDGVVYIWSFPEMVLRTTASVGEGRTVLLSVAFSPDGLRFACGSHNGVLYVCDAHTGDILESFDARAGSVMAVAFSPRPMDGRIAAGYSGNLAVLWGGSSPPIRLEGHGDKVPAVAFSPDGALLATGCEDSRIRLWNAASGVLLEGKEWIGHPTRVFALAFDSAQNLISGGEDGPKFGTVRIWPTGGASPPTIIEGHSDRVRCVAVRADGSLIASGSEDRTVRTWDRSGVPRVTMLGHSSRARSVAFVPAGDRIVSVADDQTVRVWEADTGRQIQSVLGHTTAVKALAAVPGGALIVSGGEDRLVRTWRLTDGKCLASALKHAGPIWAVAVSPDARLVATGSDDQTVRLWRLDGRTGTLVDLGTELPHGHRVFSLAFSPDGRFLASGAEDQRVRIWKLRNNPQWLVTDLAPHRNGVTSVAFDPNSCLSRFLLSASDDRTIRTWSCGSWSPQELTWWRDRFRQRVNVVVVSPSGAVAAAGGAEGGIAIWSVADGALRRSISHGRRVLALTFLNDARLLAGDDEGAVWMLDWRSGKPMVVANEPDGSVNALCRLESGNNVVVAGERRISLWTRTRTWRQQWSSIGERLYERTHITDVHGLTPPQRAALEVLGAVDIERRVEMSVQSVALNCTRNTLAPNEAEDIYDEYDIEISSETPGIRNTKICELIAQLDRIEEGSAGSTEFEAWCQKAIRICFAKGLRNVELKPNKLAKSRRDVVATNLGEVDAWRRIYDDYGTRQVTFEIKNYPGLEASDYQQVQSYLTGEYGRLAFLVTRDDTVDLYANKDVEWVREMYTNHRVLIIKLTAKFFTNLLQKLRNPQKHDTVNTALHRLLDTYTRLYLGGQTKLQTGTRKRKKSGKT